MSEFVTRFAPSPTGYLHLGHACSAFHVWDAARAVNGRVLLRIEDIDQTRCRPEYETAILDDLRWLGLDWDGPVRRQSDHFDDYKMTITDLQVRGLVYRCFRTRREIAAAMPAGVRAENWGFTGRPLPASEEARRLARGEPFAWRLSLAAAREALGPRYDGLSYLDESDGTARQVPADLRPFGDVVLARKETPASYHLACCHDDALQGVTHVIRGEDIREMTAVHALLQALMDWPQPVYRFHPLMMGPDGRKLSKRAGDRGLRAWRDEGKTPDDLRRMTGLS
jgi:glutamyl-Q tRNA(Asp) synthetase